MVTFNYTEEFLRQAKRLAKHYHSLADDINAFQFEMMENPEAGVSLGGGKRKIRLGVKSKGGPGPAFPSCPARLYSLTVPSARM